MLYISFIFKETYHQTSSFLTCLDNSILSILQRKRRFIATKEEWQMSNGLFLVSNEAFRSVDKLFKLWKVYKFIQAKCNLYYNSRQEVNIWKRPSTILLLNKDWNVNTFPHKHVYVCLCVCMGLSVYMKNIMRSARVRIFVLTIRKFTAPEKRWLLHLSSIYTRAR